MYSKADTEIFQKIINPKLNWGDDFWSDTKVISCGCIEWVGKYQNNSPKFKSKYTAHRVAFAMKFGYLPMHPERVISHKCFNRRCVNPDHFEDASVHENNHKPDMFAIHQNKVYHIPTFLMYADGNNYIRNTGYIVNQSAYDMFMRAVAYAVEHHERWQGYTLPRLNPFIRQGNSRQFHKINIDMCNVAEYVDRL